MKLKKTTVLNQLYSLILDTTISQNERDVFLEAKNKLETGENLERTMFQLQNHLSTLALKQELSTQSLNFYQTILQSFQKPSKWSYLNVFKR